MILCGGAINSPQLLMLSGIGPAPSCGRTASTSSHDLPGVGENLQDHLEFYFQVACTQPITLYASLRTVRKLRHRPAAIVAARARR